MMNLRKHVQPEQASESYSPRVKPAILRMVEEIKKMEIANEVQVEQITELCSIVDRPEMKVVGIALPVSYESRGYGGYYGFEHASCTLNDYFYTKKLIAEGDMTLLSSLISRQLKGKEIVTVRSEVQGDGNYKVLVGYEVDSFDGLPGHLPEYTETLTVPACRYAKVLINEGKQAERIGYDERMHADEYFVGEFRNDTSYVYNPSGLSFNTYDESGDILTKYEPVMIADNAEQRFASIRFKAVTLPDMKIACSMTPPDSEEFVITKYFGVQDQVFATEAAKYYLHDYYGFALDSGEEGKYNSCFGTRVSSFDSIPGCVEKITLPGGIYLHITQLEVNGDNPGIPYDITFNYLDELFFSANPGYTRDWSRQVIARFRQANCASVFVPLGLE
ncbi:GyrI-like domain-containing protein [Paenibacillus sp. MMS20-IR301]|uniref:GyrI-like domain-containing protein n=1 Tax=Paenibacillus sp. MMS20-IR301 TaxID=2895946 RepID=UPI0028E5D48C|nr:GyrI-like domain-containing protein [Paenibacillus sp. MMS20-IR301]WNS41480.1 GyrI-like domain-containing protein [Paenibacillus sp. MMS20-IR301]